MRSATIVWSMALCAIEADGDDFAIKISWTDRERNGRSKKGKRDYCKKREFVLKIQTQVLLSRWAIFE
jgi:hypothetical protein